VEELHRIDDVECDEHRENRRACEDVDQVGGRFREAARSDLSHRGVGSVPGLEPSSRNPSEWRIHDLAVGGAFPADMSQPVEAVPAGECGARTAWRQLLPSCRSPAADVAALDRQYLLARGGHGELILLLGGGRLFPGRIEFPEVLLGNVDVRIGGSGLLRLILHGLHPRQQVHKRVQPVLDDPRPSHRNGFEKNYGRLVDGGPRLLPGHVEFGDQEFEDPLLLLLPSESHEEKIDKCFR